MKRKQMNFNDDLYSWYELKAKEIGISVSGLMVIALKQYIEQQEALSFAKTGLPELMKKLEELKTAGQA